MSTKNNDSYSRLAEWLDAQKKAKTNGAIITFPGCGLTFRLNKYVEKNRDTNYLVKEGEELGDFNIVLMSFVGNNLVLKTVDDYLRIAGSEQKMIMVIDDPGVLDSEEFKSSLLSGRIYEYYWHGAFDETSTQLLVSEFKKNCRDDVYKLSGGISRLVKYLCLKDNGVSIKELLEDTTLQSICRPMIEVIKNSSTSYLEKLKIVDKGQVKSEILRKLLSDIWLSTSIKIENDLTICEDGNRGEKLARVEKDILTAMLQNNGCLPREKVAGIKWGSENFTDFSDQAINKTMRRLSSKMKVYKIETIWKTGFKLTKK
ncbi:hypothetical protein KBC75_01455 [Candidatus Shapirobacteria bacterium]|nr:hypothetical protein [Candidatus Shapirobacteria bacterium]